MSSERVQWDVNITFSAEKKYVVYAETEEEALQEAEEKFFNEMGPNALSTRTLFIEHSTVEKTDA